MAKNMSSQILLILICIIPSALSQEHVANEISIEQILAQPDDSIDIALADLVLAKDFYPNLKLQSFLYMLDYMAGRFAHFFGKYTDPDQRVRALNTFLYKKGAWNDGITFSYDEDDLQVAKPSNKFINGYLATRKGSCITMPMLYLALAERLGLPMYAARLPYHFIVRYVPEELTRNFHENIEATNGGGYVSDKEYRRTFQVPEKAVKNGVYLRTLTRRQFVASLLLVNANEWIVRKNFERAKYYLELSMMYDSTFSSAFMNYGLLHLQEAQILERKLSDEKAAEIAFHPIFDGRRKGERESLSAQVRHHKSYDHLEEPVVSTLKTVFDRNRKDMPRRDLNGSAASSTSRPGPKTDTDLQASLLEIDRRYRLQIDEKLLIYERCKREAEELGIVRGYPLLFFKHQANELNQSQQKGDH